MIIKRSTISLLCIIIIFIIACNDEQVMTLSKKDFSLNEFGYNSYKTEIEKKVGSPIHETLLGIWYKDKVKIIYRNKKAVFIFLVSSNYKTHHGIKVSDDIKKVISLYGKPHKISDTDSKKYIEYTLADSTNSDYDLFIGFEIEDSKVKNITIADYKAANFGE